MISINFKPLAKKIILPVVVAGLGAVACAACSDKKTDDKTMDYLSNNPKTAGTLAAFSLLGCLGSGKKCSDPLYNKIKDIKSSIIEAIQYQEDKENIISLCDF